MLSRNNKKNKYVNFLKNAKNFNLRVISSFLIFSECHPFTVVIGLAAVLNLIVIGKTIQSSHAFAAVTCDLSSSSSVASAPCIKCSAQVSPYHILEWLGLTKQDLADRPNLVLDFL